MEQLEFDFEPAPYEIPRRGDETTTAGYVAEFIALNHLT